METKRGIIIGIQGRRGFGFIKPDEEGENIFFHARSVEGPSFNQLKAGDTVEYLEIDAPRGKAAIAVVVM